MLPAAAGRYVLPWAVGLLFLRLVDHEIPASTAASEHSLEDLACSAALETSRGPGRGGRCPGRAAEP